MDHVIEQAKTGRASCRSCRKKIEKGAWRFGEAAPNQFDPDGGMTLRWHHLECAAKRIPDVVRPVLASFEGTIEGRDDIEKLLASGSEKGGDAKSFPYAEKAPTGRSRCIECDETIEKGSWRVAIEREIDTGSFVRTGAGYLHPACVGSHAGEEIWEEVEANSGLAPAELEELRGQA